MIVDTTVVYENLEDSYREGYPTIIMQGGTRSSKTYNILIWLIVKANSEWKGKVIDIVRETMTSLRASAMFDFFQILEGMNKYDINNHNRSESIYKIGTNTFRFFGADDDQKVRGPGRDILFCNEINGFKYKSYKQLNQRTKELTIGDYNPSDEFHWIYDHILTDKETAFFITTFRDNPFLPSRIIKQIKKYKETDPNYWRIYGLGLKGVAQATIYQNWEITKKKWEDIEGQEFFGEDYGFNNPTVILRVKYHKKGIYIDQLLYQANLTSDDIVKKHDKLREDNLLTYDDELFGDCSRPEIIEDICRAGYNCRGAKKGKDSVLRGINFNKNHKIYITERSLELIKEIRSYKWKVDKDDHVLDSPVELNDHGMDAIRYALSTLSKDQGKSGILTDSESVFGGDF